jgi:hypothetical protein
MQQVLIFKEKRSRPSVANFSCPLKKNKSLFFSALPFFLAFSIASCLGLFFSLCLSSFIVRPLPLLDMSSSAHEAALATVRLIEQSVQRDEGKRGLEFLLQPDSNELYNAARALVTKNSIAIITGFPCLVDCSPPTETDGPLGAVAIADILLKLGKNVHILTDECNEEPVLSCVAQSGLFASSKPLQEGFPSRLTLGSFPARTEFDEKDAERLSDILE